MTRPDDLHSMRQMLDHAREAVAFTSGKSTYEVSNDRLLSLALIRLLEVIGEAATRVSLETRVNQPDIPWSQIVSLRNRLIHGYDSVDMEIIWQIIQDDLAPLIVELEKRLDTEPEH